MFANNYDEFKQLYINSDNWTFMGKDDILKDEHLNCIFVPGQSEYEQVLVNKKLNMVYRHVQWFADFKNPKNFKEFKIQKDYLERMCSEFETNKSDYKYTISCLRNEPFAKVTVEDVQTVIDGMVKNHTIDKDKIYLMIDVRNNTFKQHDFGLKHIFTTFSKEECEMLKNEYGVDTWESQEYYIYRTHENEFIN